MCQGEHLGKLCCSWLDTDFSPLLLSQAAEQKLLELHIAGGNHSIPAPLGERQKLSLRAHPAGGCSRQSIPALGTRRGLAQPSCPCLAPAPGLGRAGLRLPSREGPVPALPSQHSQPGPHSSGLHTGLCLPLQDRGVGAGSVPLNTGSGRVICQRLSAGERIGIRGNVSSLPPCPAASPGPGVCVFVCVQTKFTFPWASTEGSVVGGPRGGGQVMALGLLFLTVLAMLVSCQEPEGNRALGGMRGVMGCPKAAGTISSKPKAWHRQSGS